METSMSVVGTFTVSITTKSRFWTENMSNFVAAVCFIGIALPQCWKLGGSNIGVGISHVDTPPLAKMGCP